MKVGLVCVHYHAAALACRALEAVRLDAERSGLSLQPVIVDNGSTPAELDVLRTSGTRVVGPGANPGYAAGVNQGARHLPDADVLIAMNPDVMVEPGCLSGLLAELDDGAQVAGPRFFWDAPGGYQLPPTESCSRRAELLRALAHARGGKWATRARSAWRRHADRHWRSKHATDSYDLSGAMLVMSAEAWRRVGPFDDRYRLYFEETDWLQRCRKLGLRARFVGRAHAVHLYAQSTPTALSAQQWFADSQDRFRRRYYGRTFVSLLGKIAGPTHRPSLPEMPSLDRRRSWSPRSSARKVEISPSPHGFPAAAIDAGRVVDRPLVSDSLWRQMAPGTYYVRAVDDNGHECGCGSMLRPPNGSMDG